MDKSDMLSSSMMDQKAEYNAAVAEIDRLLDADPQPDSEEHERLEFLSILVQAYEDAHFPMDKLTTPQDAVEFMLDQKGLSRTDLAGWMGGKKNVTEFFKGARNLSLREIEVLREKLGIPADLLMGGSRRASNA